MGNDLRFGEDRYKKRLSYIDVLRFIGMLSIYVGYYLDSAGLLYNFVFEFHVPLLSFLSGCTETLSKNLDFRKKIGRKFFNIMIPF